MAGIWFFFKSKGLKVTGLEGSEVAINLCEEKNLQVALHDLEVFCDLPARPFDVIYSHLGLHYFTDKRTRELFSELSGWLYPGSFFCFRVRSTKDTRYIDGVELEKNFYKKGERVMHLFSSEYIDELLHGFDIIKKEEFPQPATDLKKYGPNFSFRVIAQKQLVF